MDKTKVVFIIGMGHTGSTLLNMIIGAHSRCFSLSEISNLDNWVIHNKDCTCGKPVRECPFWSDTLSTYYNQPELGSVDEENIIQTDIFNTRKHFKDRSFYRIKAAIVYSLFFLLPRKWAKKTIQVFFPTYFKRTVNTMNLFSRVSEKVDNRILIDSSKALIRMVILYLLYPENVRALFLTRDGRGTMNSYLKRTRTTHKYKTIRPASFTFDWIKYYLFAGMVCKRLPADQWMQVKYEDLSKDKHGLLGRICSFLQLTPEENAFRFREIVHHNIGGNPMKFKAGQEIREDTSWRKELPENYLYTFNKYADWLNRRINNSSL